MNPLLADLLQVLRLERLELDLFRGESRDPGHHRVFGGQVLGQALAAAYATIENRGVHSLHAYFLRAGDPDHPIVYEVDRSRDGASFTSRRVVAIQHGEQIFHMSASFQVQEEGVDRQGVMPDVPGPESLPDMAVAVEEMKKKAPDRPRPFIAHDRPFEFRPALLPDPTAEVPREPSMRIWFRAVDRVPDDEVLHRCLLAYASDYYLLGTAVMDARLAVGPKNLQMASIDHAMWFHRPARADEWLLYVLDSPTSSSSRGFARGSIFSRDGTLVASTAQEGLVRRRKPEPAA
ncbi:acyl-CoA thioesterase-2 [Povalibacter uvarum]|uniref:Acyl-CoA thioesterase 2 n=1 Tax=Povalibacter uvarum TaxID=732238 RepID=A0A841HK07_9GAMM|nr:acyl-CoA thioesterase II [Povalibacter uvarum]MBB6093541.1 acyl-CoA thioesterase-2 [Povalibacter uvarum]